VAKLALSGGGPEGSKTEHFDLLWQSSSFVPRTSRFFPFLAAPLQSKSKSGNRILPHPRRGPGPLLRFC
jgi:hypothetical protein